MSRFEVDSENNENGGPEEIWTPDPRHVKAYDNNLSGKNTPEGGARWFNSDPDFRAYPKINWQQFHSFLLQRMTPKTAQDRMRYAKQYAHVICSLQTSSINSGSYQLLQQLSPNKRIHVMKALSCLAKFLGCYDSWTVASRKYQLSWSTGAEKLYAFQRFFDDSHTLDKMLHWLHEAIEALPVPYSRFLIFCTMTGLRGSEAIESVRLLNHDYTCNQYYDPMHHVVQHYRFPELFIRRTKAVYISVVNDKIIALGRNFQKTPTLNGLKKAISNRSLSMQLKYCRKIYASWLHSCGISSDLIDMLQGRMGKNIFLKHYLTPSSEYKAQVLQALEKLQQQL